MGPTVTGPVQDPLVVLLLNIGMVESMSDDYSNAIPNPNEKFWISKGFGQKVAILSKTIRTPTSKNDW